jgi:dienelactone hydrolase
LPIELEVAPRVALVDEPVAIRVGGLASGARVLIRARLLDQDGNTWTSHAVFDADESGAVDASRRGPVEGTYDDADPMGLFWSLALPADIPPPLSVMVKEHPDPTSLTIEAEVEGAVVASVDVERLLQHPDVTRTDVRDDGLVGTLFLPPGEGPHPAIIVMTGSDGGLKEDKAALLASRGFATLALAFFGLPGLPETLHEVPLEYFERAIRFLQAHDAVDGDAIAVTGISRGGELVLLLGATFPEIKAVAAYSPSAYVYPGFTATSVGDVDSWTWQGKPFPYAPFDMGAVDMASSPIDQSPAFRPSLDEPAAAAPAAIPVERINGAVLLVSGTDDKQWQSSEFADVAYERLRENNHPFPFEHLRFEGAGHLIRYPYVPTTVTYYRHPVVPLDFALGGNAKANEAAAEGSWRRLLDFLRENLQAVRA